MLRYGLCLLFIAFFSVLWVWFFAMMVFCLFIVDVSHIGGFFLRNTRRPRSHNRKIRRDVKYMQECSYIRRRGHFLGPASSHVPILNYATTRHKTATATTPDLGPSFVFLARGPVHWRSRRFPRGSWPRYTL